ncbi:MAG: hypothetical protein HRT74_13780, partial [Flavobacteriales bacterium]|nr:hypothetical protein [Flavobacteriales bacterium]
MKKLYILLIAVMFSAMTYAQVDITFEVDMNNETVDGMVHIAGDFGADYPVWQPDGIPMADEDMDGVYSVTLSLMPGTYQ